MMIDIPSSWMLSIIMSGVALILAGVKFLLTTLNNLHDLIEKQNEKYVPRETFNEFKQYVINTLENLNFIKTTQAIHEEHLKIQDTTLQEIKSEIHLLKTKIYS
jgi:hypothetical protein